MTSAPVRDPLVDHLLAPENAALLFIGYLDQFVFELQGAPPAPSQP
jgi:hypothetical protein